MKKIFLLTAIVSFVIFAPAGCGNPNEKVFGVGELAEKATADQDSWKGKEVTVSGYVTHMSRSDGANGYRLSMIDHERDETERHVSCKVPQGVLPEGIATKTVEVKGKIGLITKRPYMNFRSVELESCEIKK